MASPADWSDDVITPADPLVMYRQSDSDAQRHMEVIPPTQTLAEVEGKLGMGDDNSHLYACNDTPIVDPDGGKWMTVKYQYLTAEQCVALKAAVDGHEDGYTWGSRGPDGGEELNERPLTDLDTDHLENILITQPQIDNARAAAILSILRKRYKEQP